MTLRDGSTTVLRGLPADYATRDRIAVMNHLVELPGSATLEKFNASLR